MKRFVNGAIAAAAALMCGFGCNCSSDQVVRSHARISASPAVLDFGALEPGAMKSIEVTLSNAGSVALRINNISIVHNDRSAFRTTPPSSGEISQIPAGGSVVAITVVYTAAGQDSRDDSELEIRSTADDAPILRVPLTGATVVAASDAGTFADAGAMADAGEERDAAREDAAPADASPIDAGAPDATPSTCTMTYHSGSGLPPGCFDLDGDGFAGATGSCASGDDCDDTDPLTYRGALEIALDGKDNACGGGSDLTVSDTTGIFVASTGSASNPGTMAQPVSTISRGVMLAAQASKVVFVATGMYPESVTTTVPIYGGFESTGWQRNLVQFPTTIVPGALTAMINSGGMYQYSVGHVGIFVPSGASAVIDGINIIGGCTGIAQDVGRGLMVLKDVRVQTMASCTPTAGVFTDASAILYRSQLRANSSGTSNGLFVWTDATATHTYFSDISAGSSSSLSDAVALLSGTHLILSSRIDGGTSSGGNLSSCGGVSLGGNPNAHLDVTLVNDVIDGACPGAQGTAGVRTPGGNNVTGQLILVNDVIFAGGGTVSSIAVQDLDAFPLVLVDSIVVGGTGPSYLLVAAGPATNRYVHGNDFYLPSSGCLASSSYSTCTVATIADVNRCGSGVCTTGSQNQSADPRFVGASQGDYHLAADSPCINTGVDPDIAYHGNLVDLDFEGDCRPMMRASGAGFDIGIDEHVP